VYFEPRSNPGWLSAGLVTLGSLAVGLLLGAALFLCRGVDPLVALQRIVEGSFGSLYGFKETVTKAMPLALTAVGLVVAFRGKIWNIGAEGQMLCGAVAAAGVGLFVGPQWPAWLVVPAMFVAGAAAGAGFGAIPALMRVRWGVNEAISSLMLNYVAAQGVFYLIYGPWKGKQSFGFPVSDDLGEAARLGTLAASRIHWPTLVLVVCAVVVLAVIMARGRFGFEVRVVGENPGAARYAGIPEGRVILMAMLLSGGLAGCAGVGELAGIHHHLTSPVSLTSGYGFTAIIVAFLARLQPLAVIPAALFFGGILVGGDVIQTRLQLPFATVNVFNGLILFAMITGEYFRLHRLRMRSAAPTEPGAPGRGDAHA